MGSLGVQLLLEDNARGTEYHIGKNSNYSSSSTEWSLLNKEFTEPNHGIRL